MSDAISHAPSDVKRSFQDVRLAHDAFVSCPPATELVPGACRYEVIWGCAGHLHWMHCRHVPASLCRLSQSTCKLRKGSRGQRWGGCHHLTICGATLRPVSAGGADATGCMKLWVFTRVSRAVLIVSSQALGGAVLHVPSA
jgi:hypothetical protein